MSEELTTDEQWAKLHIELASDIAEEEAIMDERDEISKKIEKEEVDVTRQLLAPYYYCEFPDCGKEGTEQAEGGEWFCEPHFPNKPPFKCPNCNEPLDTVAFDSREVWEYNPETGKYHEEGKYGYGVTKCYLCDHPIQTKGAYSEGPVSVAFAEGPANYTIAE